MLDMVPFPCRCKPNCHATVLLTADQIREIGNRGRLVIIKGHPYPDVRENYYSVVATLTDPNGIEFEEIQPP